MVLFPFHFGTCTPLIMIFRALSQLAASMPQSSGIQEGEGRGGEGIFNSLHIIIYGMCSDYDVCFNFLRLSFVMSKGLLLPLGMVLVTIQPLLPLTSAALTVTSTFNQSGVIGTINFTQADSNAPTVMDISLTGTYNNIPYLFTAW
jgi:hypothetical protein